MATDFQLIAWVTMALIGFAMLILSVFFGGDSDVGGDIGGDVSADVGGADATGVSPLSIPVIATFLSTSGATGTILHLTNAEIIFTVGGAVTVGVLSFVGIYWFMNNFLAASQGSSSYHEKEYEGKTGMVTETISEDGLGAVAVTVRGTRAVVSARSDGKRIGVGAEVLVKRVTDSVAFVEELKHT